MQIFKWMPLKAEEQNLQTETLLSNCTSVDQTTTTTTKTDQPQSIINQEDQSNKLSSNATSEATQNNINGLNHTDSSSLIHNNNNNINNNAMPNDQSIGNHPIVRNGPDFMNSSPPPTKRMKSSEDDNSMESNKEEDVMPVEQEPQFDELCNLGRAKPVDQQSPCLTPTPVVPTNLQQETTGNLPSIKENSQFPNRNKATNNVKMEQEDDEDDELDEDEEDNNQDRNSILHSTMVKDEPMMVETNIKEIESQPMDMEDFTSIAKSVTDEIVLNVSQNRLTNTN